MRMVQDDVIQLMKQIAEQQERDEFDDTDAVAANARMNLARELLQRMGVSYGGRIKLDD